MRLDNLNKVLARVAKSTGKATCAYSPALGSDWPRFVLFPDSKNATLNYYYRFDSILDMRLHIEDAACNYKAYPLLLIWDLELDREVLVNWTVTFDYLPA
jgi:hypothetical protein